VHLKPLGVECIMPKSCAPVRITFSTYACGRSLLTAHCEVFGIFSKQKNLLPVRALASLPLPGSPKTPHASPAQPGVAPHLYPFAYCTPVPHLCKALL